MENKDKRQMALIMRAFSREKLFDEAMEYFFNLYVNRENLDKRIDALRDEANKDLFDRR